LGAFLTEHEATRLAAALHSGDTTTQALKEIHIGRRPEAKRLLAEADVGHQRLDDSVALLRAIAGARSVRSTISPVWTMPGAQASIGRLTSEAQRLIDDARMSVVCSSFNFTPNSGMWTALHAASERPGVAVTIYLDAAKGSPDTVANHMPEATVYRTCTLEGNAYPLVSHAKFMIVDRALTFLTSANFSYAAENTNIELGLLVHDTSLAESIESLMRSKHGLLYERVPST
jgi:phosphatidylserine/phosphatidylglycerophosphate/cardiolipin synthase-like enzyme